MKKYYLILAVIIVTALGWKTWISQDSNKVDTTTMKIFFASRRDNENMLDCTKTDEVKRTVNASNKEPRNAMRQLFIGPTAMEKKSGLMDFWITEENGSLLERLFIVNNTAYLSWGDLPSIIPNAGSSCGSAIFLTPIENTLKEFPEVTRVIHALKNDPTAFYEWIQIGCQEFNDYCDNTAFLKMEQETSSKN